MDSNINRNLPSYSKLRQQLDLNAIQKGFIDKDILSLSRAITLIENPKHCYDPEVLNFLSGLRPQKNTLRIAVTGSPGAGKSTLIEGLGLDLINLGYSVAVLAIDPASRETRGSILGDKTRMEKLSRAPEAFIRPSSNVLESGGVRGSSFHTIRLCEAAGYDFILVETVGVGQSELGVSEITDAVVLVLTPAGGDELQGIKKGIVESADIILVNKADHEYEAAAIRTQQHYESALHLGRGRNTIFPKVEVRTVSALEGRGIPDLAKLLKESLENVDVREKIKLKRGDQNRACFKKQAYELINHQILANDRLKNKINDLSQAQDLFKGLLKINEEFSKKLSQL